jgi:hypothetical protein
MFTPEEMDLDELQNNSFEISNAIMKMQNENPFPDTGTMGFIMGLCIALGNISAMYATGQSRYQRKEFLRIVNGTVSDSFKNPYITATLNESKTVN